MGGLYAHMPLADAMALLPGLTLGDVDPIGDARARQRLATWCQRFTPWTAVEATGGLWLDISGCAHLFGGEAALLKDLTARLSTFGLSVRAAVADTPGAAWAAARYGDDNIIASGKQQSALASLPMAALRLSGDDVEGLGRLGLRRIGDLYHQPRGPLAGRFGPDVLKRLDQTLGHADEPVSPDKPAPSRRVRMTFADPIAGLENLTVATERLMDALMDKLAKEDLGVRRLDLQGFRVDGGVAVISVGTHRASRDGAHLLRLLKERFDTFDAGFGIDVLILAARGVDVAKAAQTTLNGANAAPEQLNQLTERIANKLGPARIGRKHLVERHMPEHTEVFRRCGDTHLLRQVRVPKTTGYTSQPRPLRLFSPPEPIDVMAPVPDHPPVLFKWCRRQHRILHAEGPERIAPEWWLEDPAELASGARHIRDYYRVEDTVGGRYWVYRDGLYVADVSPKWFLHGVFA